MSPRPPARRPAPRSGGPRYNRPSPSPRGTRPPEGLGGEQVEGRQAVLELLRARRRATNKILMAESLDPAAILDEIELLAQRQRIPVQLVSHARLDREARTEGHQGVVAMAARLNSVDLDSLLENPAALLLVCDGVTDPRNLGAMLRSADGAGVTGVVLPRHRSARITPAVTKTAAGAIEYLTFAEVGGIPAALERMNKLGVLTVGLDGTARQSLFALELTTGPLAIVVGSEGTGLSQLARKRCGALASLPQRGGVASLNAAAATTVALYEAARQRA